MKTFLTTIFFILFTSACFSQTVGVSLDSAKYKMYKSLTEYYTDLAKKADLSADSFYFKGRADSYEDSMQLEAQALGDKYRKEHETK